MMPVTVGPKDKTLILIVDDDLFARTAFKDALEAAGYLTATARDGDSALRIFSKRKPDLVLLDLIMPGKDGFQTCREIRSLTEGKHTPVLIVTGLDDTESIRCALEAGASDFTSKPVKPELLVHRVQYMLRSGRIINNLVESEGRLASAQVIAHLGNWEWVPATGMFWGSEEFFRILGLEQRPTIFTFESFLLCVSPPDRELVESDLKTVLHDKSTLDLECCISRSDGMLRIVRLLGYELAKGAGDNPQIAGTVQDVTETRQAEDRLGMLKEAVDCLPIGITLTDVNGKIIYSNPADAEMHGYVVEELIGREARKFACECLKKTFLPGRLEEIGIWRRESVNMRKNGQQFPVHLTSVTVRNNKGRCLGMVTACEDITNRKEAVEKIHHLAYYDTLTGLPNRRMFLDRLQQALALACRDGRKVTLLFLDLDNFKDVNDTQGHDFGDKLLRQLAETLAAGLRESDTVARLGGDEFVVILTSITSQEHVTTAAQRILSTFSRPFEIDGRQIFSSVSIGIALYPDDALDPDSLFKCADTAMYHAKNAGRSNFKFFSSEMNDNIIRRVALENNLRNGLERQEFFLQYQPQWDLKTARVSGVEVLLRWQSADLGLMMPSEFIALTEDSGLILELGEWVLRTACLQARSWALAGNRGFKVAVNISGKQLKQPDFLEMVAKIILETGIAPWTLELEFTESVIMEQADKTIETLRTLRKMGIYLSIDDFGTGYSSLSYLKLFPVDQVKIDRSFVKDVTNSTDDAAIVDAIISLSHSLKLNVLAEGVENCDQLRFMIDHGCDAVQGFFLAIPMTVEEISGLTGEMQGIRTGKQPLIGLLEDRADCPGESLEFMPVS